MTGVLDGRRKENEPSMLTASNTWKNTNALTFINEFSDHTALDGHTYQLLDPGKRVTNNPGIAQGFKDKISRFAAE